MKMCCDPTKGLYQGPLTIWLTVPGSIFVRRNVRSSKYELLLDEVELIECKPKYANVELPDECEGTVSTNNLAPKIEPQSPRDLSVVLTVEANDIPDDHEQLEESTYAKNYAHSCCHPT